MLAFFNKSSRRGNGTRSRNMLCMLALAPSLTFAHSQWSKPTFGLELIGPTSKDRDFNLMSLTVRSLLKRDRTRQSLVRLGSEFGLTYVTGKREGYSSQDALGINASVLARLQSPPIGRTRFFVEGSLGLGYFAEPFPAGGTKTNGLVRWGIGFERLIRRSTLISVQYRRMHISNGGGLVDHNPSFDGAGLAVLIRRLP